MNATRTPVKALSRAASVLLPVVCLGFLVQRFTKEAGSLPPFAWTIRACSALLAAAALVVAIEAVHSLGWRTLARGFQPGFPWRDSFVLCGTSQIAKYLPGNAFHYVQRFALARDRGLGGVAASAVIAMDVVLVLIAGVVLGLPALTPALRSAAASAVQEPWCMALVGAGLVIVCAVAAYAGRAHLERWSRLVAPILSGKRLAFATLLNLILFGLAGVMVSLVLHGFWPGTSDLQWNAFINGFALAFVAGFVTPGAPGGIGVREAILVALYEPQLGAGLAVMLFVLVRLAFIIGDCLTFATAFLLGRPLMASHRV